MNPKINQEINPKMNQIKILIPQRILRKRLLLMKSIKHSTIKQQNNKTPILKPNKMHLKQPKMPLQNQISKPLLKYIQK